MTSPLIALDAERAFLSGMLGGVTMGLRGPDHPLFRSVPLDLFASPAHRTIWRAMTELADEGIDPTRAALLSRLDDIGAAEHKPTLDDMAIEMDPGTPDYHAGVLKDRAARRRLHEAAKLVEGKTLDLEVSLSDLVDTSERLIFGATSSKSTALATPEPVKRRLMDVVSLIESGGYRGTPTGFTDLDAMLTGGGILPGQLVVVAGATSMGKTAFATGVAANIGIDAKRPVLYASIEMTEEDNALRLVCHEARADMKAVSEGDASDHDMKQIVDATAVLHPAPIYLHDESVTVNQVRSAARRLKAEAGDLALIVVDHIQDMEGPGDNRREQIGGIARSLKALAKELETTIIAVSQLRRLNTRSDYTPTLSDLKESGDVENSADGVWLLYRPEYYYGPEHEGKDLRGLAKLILAKQRNGQTGVVPLTFLPHCVRFDNRGTDGRRPGW